MTRSLFKQILLSGTSFGAVDITLDGASYYGRDEDLSGAALRGLLARVALWLQLMLRGLCGAEIESRVEAQPERREVNRLFTRMARCKIAIVRRVDPLALHVLRHKGRRAFLRWQCDRRLISRIIGYFWRWAWRGLSRVHFAGCVGDVQTLPPRAVPLRPD